MKTAAPGFTVTVSFVPVPKMPTRPAWMAAGAMGFEPPLTKRRQRFSGHQVVIGPHARYLSDYEELIARTLDEDGEAESVTWPELIDQTQLARYCGPRDFDDAEDDDPAGGDICDEPHDAREEDGI